MRLSFNIKIRYISLKCVYLCQTTGRFISKIFLHFSEICLYRGYLEIPEEPNSRDDKEKSKLT